MAAILKICYYGHHEYVCERLHIQKYLGGDSLHACVPNLVLLSKSTQFFLLSHYTNMDISIQAKNPTLL